MENVKYICPHCGYEADMPGVCPGCQSALVASCPLCKNPVVGEQVR